MFCSQDEEPRFGPHLAAGEFCSQNKNTINIEHIYKNKTNKLTLLAHLACTFQAPLWLDLVELSWSTKTNDQCKFKIIQKIKVKYLDKRLASGS